jgi:hypothetical protein
VSGRAPEPAPRACCVSDLGRGATELEAGAEAGEADNGSERVAGEDAEVTVVEVEVETEVDVEVEFDMAVNAGVEVDIIDVDVDVAGTSKLETLTELDCPETVLDPPAPSNPAAKPNANPGSSA